MLGQSPYSGSVVEGKATPEVLSLDFKDALDRGLRNNLGVLLQSDYSLAVRGQRWSELSALLPHLNATVSQSVAQIDLAALGFRFNISGIPNVLGPLGIFQSQLNLSQSVFDYRAIQRLRGAKADEKSAEHSLKDARELVVLVSRSHLEPRTQAFLDGLPNVRTIACGSAVKFCRIADGSADLYPRLAPTRDWDVAAGHALVEAAGGQLRTPDGGRLIYGTPDLRIPGFIAWADITKA